MTPLVLPRLVLSAATSSAGKTTLSFGLMAALRARGVRVAGFKVGPDYIDPGYHALATGRPGRNLDPWLCGEQRIAPLFAHGAAGAAVSLIEGVMGLYDGRLGVTDGRRGYGSTAHVARLLDAPVLLVLDAAHASRTVAAVAHGLATHPDAPRVAGVLLNRAGSPRAVSEIEDALAGVGLPLLGAVPRRAGLSVDSRHLGLVPAAEGDSAARAAVEAAAALVADHVDLDAVQALAATAPPLATAAWDPSSEVTAVTGRPRVAVATGRAFTFRYAETTELLQAAGCEVVEFDPVTAPSLPPGTAALYLGGGFPEMHAEHLAANESLRREVAAAVASGLPTYAECAGLLYLCATLDGEPMAGALPMTARMGPRLVLRYDTHTPDRDSVVVRAGEPYRFHEFHRTVVDPPDAEPHQSATVHAGYHHIHWAGHPLLAQRFADAAAAYAGRVTDNAGRVADNAGRVAGEERAGVSRPTPTHTGSRHGPSSVGPYSTNVTPTESRHGPSSVGPYSTNVTPSGSRHGPSSVGPYSTNVTPSGSRHGPSSVGPYSTNVIPSGSRHGPYSTNVRPYSTNVSTTDLRHHGDADLAPGLVDLAVNVREHVPPPWLLAAITTDPGRWARYPDAAPAIAALAARHGVDPTMVLPTAGAAEAFTLVVHGVRPRRPVVVHPQFTEPEAALVDAGIPVVRHLLAPDRFILDPETVPADADLVVVGNPTNPTGTLHPAAALRALARPGRVLLVDEAFMDFVPGEPESLIGPQMPGLLVVRSLTKMWGVAGLRAGYVIGDPALVAKLAAQQRPWAVPTPAVDALIACSTPDAVAAADAAARASLADRVALVTALADAGFPVAGDPQTPFVLIDTSQAGPGSLREPLAARGFAVRRGDTFPGLGPTWLRVAARNPQTSQAFASALNELRRPRMDPTTERNPL